MCDVCEDDDIRWEDSTAGLNPQLLVRAARMVESDLPGPRIAEEMWEIYCGQQAGSLDWSSFERIERSRKAAATLLVATRGWFAGERA